MLERVVELAAELKASAAELDLELMELKKYIDNYLRSIDE